MHSDPDGRSSLDHRLEQTAEVATSFGLLLSGVVFAAGVAGLLYVVNHVTATSPPSFGSQGEWLYGAVACLLVAGWGFGHGATFYARRRSAETRHGGFSLPNVRVRPDGISIDMNSSQSPRAGEGQPFTFTWSLNPEAVPMKTLEITEAQLAQAEGAAGPGADWEFVARTVNPDYTSLSAFEQKLYRHALKTSVEHRRQKR